ncbi:VHS and GAT domain-containing protein [Penicillium ucsense]|uniref:VHS and GAT domain-containing protein n=1 Tax=Penicillium ucsense TaxID=2839758 RepID=A0A8J8WM24_9EURO|nr:VHS and GAT domain-containing protein [Penicillium ucsense]KAF7730217.1 VHS and GAT domain-containing protein [Penicillium ucsense]
MFSSAKPFSAVSVQIEVLTSEQYEVEDSSGIVDLIEVVRIQGSGPQEASRALRKKLKYGNIHRQLRALTILDFLIQNAGERFLREFADEPLLERLRIAGTDPVSDPLVKEKCKQLFGQWAVTYKDTPGMQKIAALYRQLPKRKQPATQAKAKVLREGSGQSETPMGHTVTISAGNGPATTLSSPKQKSKSKDKKREKKLSISPKNFNLERERPQIYETIASASVASTNLLNSLKLVNRETTRVSDDAECSHRFNMCKKLRHQILRYIQQVESEEFLGGLIHANEELVTALMAFEVLDKSLDYDSDSDDDVLSGNWRSRSEMHSDMNDSFSGLSINPPRPPRPSQPVASSSRPPPESESESEESEDDDEDNPFGDRNAIKTPGLEKAGYSWKEV